MDIAVFSIAHRREATLIPFCFCFWMLLPVRTASRRNKIIMKQKNQDHYNVPIVPLFQFVLLFFSKLFRRASTSVKSLTCVNWKMAARKANPFMTETNIANNNVEWLHLT